MGISLGVLRLGGYLFTLLGIRSRFPHGLVSRLGLFEMPSTLSILHLTSSWYESLLFSFRPALSGEVVQ